MASSNAASVVRADAPERREQPSPQRNHDTNDRALAQIMSDIEISMQALALNKDPTLKSQLRSKLERLLSKAEEVKQLGRDRRQPTKDLLTTPQAQPPSDPDRLIKLKVPISTRELSTAEKIIVLKASQLHGFKFPPWQKDPLPSDFELKPGEALFIDQADLRLSPRQMECLDAWKRPHDALIGQSELDSNWDDSMMGTKLETDLVQDAATDCSVVASLCAVMARSNRGHHTDFQSLLFPCNRQTDRPIISPSGKYIFKFFFNGAYRRVEIDDRLPTSKTSRSIHVVDRNNPKLLWPALIEKAYLKVRGGYDFLGSNSGTDIWIMSGWIPEQIFLSSEDTSVYDIWSKVFNAYTFGDVLISCGTGKMSADAERDTGLAGEHDYAVIDMREVKGQKFVLIKNPWSDTSNESGAGVATRSPLMGSVPSTDEDQPGSASSSHALLNEGRSLPPGTFWMDLNSVAQHFEAVYLNWHPGLFGFRQDIHFSWDLSSGSTSTSLVKNPQFTFTVNRGGVAWLLLNRHFQSTAADTMADRTQPAKTIATGWINLYLYDSGGHRVYLNGGSIARGSFVDSPQVLLRLDDLRPNHAYTVVVAQEDLPVTQHTFTLCAWSNSAINLEKAPDRFACTNVIPSSWSEDTAGGNTHSPLYSRNPQFSLSVPRLTPMILHIECRDPTLPVHVKVVHGQGKRVHSVRSRDVVFDSKEHRRGCAIAESRGIEAGTYTIICSTYEPGQTAAFDLRVDSSVLLKVLPLPREGAGRIKMALPTLIFHASQQRMAIPLRPERLTKFAAMIKHTASSSASTPTSTFSNRSQSQARSMIRITVESWSGRMEPDRVLTTSADGDYSDSNSGVFTRELDLSPAMARDAGIWLVVERMFSAKDLVQEAFSADIYVEAPHAVTLGEWKSIDD